MSDQMQCNGRFYVTFSAGRFLLLLVLRAIIIIFCRYHLLESESEMLFVAQTQFLGLLDEASSSGKAVLVVVGEATNDEEWVK